MKRKLLRILVAVLIVSGAWTIAPVSFTGCKQIPSTSQQTADQVILRAEQTAQTARLTMDTFVHLERDNEALLKQVNPQIHQYANTIRRNGLNWVDSLRAATKAFKANRTPENEATVNTWLTTLITATTQMNQYIAQSRQAIHP